MWRKLHRRRSAALSPQLSPPGAGIDSGDEGFVSDSAVEGDKLALVMPLDLEHIAGVRGLTRERTRDRVVAGGDEQPLTSPSVTDVQKGEKQKRRRSLLAGLLPRIASSPTNLSFTRTSSDSS